MINSQSQYSAYGLLYIYEYILTINYQFLNKKIKLLDLINELQNELNYRPSILKFSKIKEELFLKFHLDHTDYAIFSSNDSTCSLKVHIDSLIINDDYLSIKKQEVDPNAKHVSNIPGITGKGDLSQKAHYRALSPDLNKETALTFTYGKIKHTEDNFRKMDDKASGEIWDALMRHLESYRLGETHADDSKRHHLAHACANIHMLYRIITRHGDQKVLEIITGGDINGTKRD